jgi:hypothetical protein
VVRSLYDYPEIPEGVLCRVVVATHPTSKKKSSVGVTRSGVVYELFFTTLPQQAFTAADVVELYLNRGALRACALRSGSEDRSRSLVQPLGLGAGVLAGGLAMGVELPPGTGAPAGP